MLLPYNTLVLDVSEIQGISAEENSKLMKKNRIKDKEVTKHRMTAKEQKFFECSTWYHGTTLSGWKSICRLGIKADFNVGISLDFGNGFYLSNDIQNTERYVRNMIKYSNSDFGEDNVPVITVFEFVPFAWLLEGATYHYFPKYDMEFAEFVFENRLNYKNQNMHGYDITAGVTTDAKPTYLMQQYFLGNMQKKDVLKEFCKGTSVRQICIHNQKLCDIIYPKEAYILEGKELNIHDYNQRQRNS